MTVGGRKFLFRIEMVNHRPHYEGIGGTDQGIGKMKRYMVKKGDVKNAFSHPLISHWPMILPLYLLNFLPVSIS